MPTVPQIKFPDVVRDLIHRWRSRKSAKEISAALGITAGRLSQFAAGSGYPRLDLLVQMANYFEVTLDELVLGRGADEDSAPLDVNPWVKMIDHRLWTLESQGSSRALLFSRIAEELTKQIDTATKRVLADMPAIGGLSHDPETQRMESFSLETRLLLFSFDYNVVKRDGEAVPDAAGGFVETVAHNLIQGRTYDFIFPAWVEGKKWIDLVNMYRRMLKGMRVSQKCLDTSCRFYTTNAPMVGGCGLYRLDVASLQRDEGQLYQRFSKYIGKDGWFGYIPPPSSDLLADGVMSVWHAEQSRVATETLLAPAHRKRYDVVQI